MTQPTIAEPTTDPRKIINRDTLAVNRLDTKTLIDLATKWSSDTAKMVVHNRIETGRI